MMNQIASNTLNATRIRKWMLGVYLIYALILTLNPFDFSLHWAELFLHKPAKELFGGKVFDIIGNVLFFIPLGFLLGFNFDKSSQKRTAFFLRVTFTGALFSLGIETTQIFLQRTTSVVDVSTNTAGTALGCTLALWRIWERAPLTQIIRIFRTRGIRILIAMAYAVLLGWILFQPIRLNRLDSWDESYPFLLGNEGTDDRPWRGEIRSLLIFDRALKADEIQRLTIHTVDGLPIPLVAGLRPLAAFPFDERGGNVARNLTNSEMPLRLSETGVTPSLTGLRFHSGKVASFPLGRMLTERIKATSEFTLSLWLRSDDLNQTGPARIVSISKNPDRRDFTLGQDGRQLVLRVRTPQTDKNGSRIPLFSGNVLDDTLFHHVAATFHHGVARIYVDGSPAGRPLYAHRDYLPEWYEYGAGFLGWFAFCLILFWPLALLIYTIPRRNRFSWMGALLLGFVVVIDVLYYYGFGQPFGPWLVFPVLGVCLITGWIGFHIRRERG